MGFFIHEPPTTTTKFTLGCHHFRFKRSISPIWSWRRTILEFRLPCCWCLLPFHIFWGICLVFNVEPKNIQIEKYRILSTSFIVLHSEELCKMQNILQKYKKYIHTYKHQTTQSTLEMFISKKNTFSFASLYQKIVLEVKKMVRQLFLHHFPSLPPI